MFRIIVCTYMPIHQSNVPGVSCHRFIPSQRSSSTSASSTASSIIINRTIVSTQTGGLDGVSLSAVSCRTPAPKSPKCLTINGVATVGTSSYYKRLFSLVFAERAIPTSVGARLLLIFCARPTSYRMLHISASSSINQIYSKQQSKCKAFDVLVLQSSGCIELSSS